MKMHRITLLFSVALVGIVSCLPSSMIYPTVTPVPPITHTAGNLTGIEPIWTLDDIYVIWSADDITLDTFMGKTCFLGDIGERGLYKNFICLESQNGQLLWSKQTGVQRTITMTSDGIFIAYSSPGELKKYDLQTGDLVWRRRLGGTGSINLTYLNNQIQVSTTNPETLWLLDTNGKVTKKMREGEHRIFLSTSAATYVNLNGVRVLKTGTNEVLWEHLDIHHLRQVPIFTEDKLFLRNGDNFSGTAYALNRADGELLWEIPNIVGNLAYSPKKHIIYALLENGDLLTIDENTGKETVIAKFPPSPFLFFDGVDACAYQLAYDDEENYLIVYLGDSRQLFAFQDE
jgi:outer membrane protein assembly factor BamB